MRLYEFSNIYEHIRTYIQGRDFKLRFGVIENKMFNLGCQIV